LSEHGLKDEGYFMAARSLVKRSARVISEASGFASCITMPVFLATDKESLEEREQINRNALPRINQILRPNPVEALNKELLSDGARFYDSTCGFASRGDDCNCFSQSSVAV
jgi:hypothetical protein